MRRNLSKKGKTRAAFMAMLFVTTFIISFLPEVALAEVAITVEPEEGYVGDTIRVNGTIETPDGDYTIIFDEEPVKSGTAVERTVNDTFLVPRRPMGNYNVTLHDVEANKNDTAVFTLKTAYHIKAVVPPKPKQLQEFSSTEIWVNVTGGEANTVYFANVTVKEPPPAISTYWTTVSLTDTTTTGYGEGSVTYPADFGAGAHTNYTGIYNIAFNKTLASGHFTVGLTNATEYHRFQFVSIRGANYTQPNEYAWVNVTLAGEIVFSENVLAVGGMIPAIWGIPANASMGLYTVSITSSITNGTVKPVLDTQNFTIVEIPCQIQTKKLNGEVLADVKVDAYNATGSVVASNKTDDEGLTSVLVEGGNYTFDASWAIKPEVYVQVGTLVNQSIKEEPKEPLVLWCWIAYLNISISPPLPFINITLTYQNMTLSTHETNSTGIWEIPGNLPTNISYTIEARRYDFLFHNKTLEKLSAAMNVSWVNITITVPTYTMFVHVLDSKGHPIQNVEVAAYEWSSGVAEPAKSGTTNSLGSATLPCTFGKYKVWVYNQDRTIVLNKTVVDLIEDRFLTIHCKIFNVDLSVVVKDYFGNPISNALVKVERENVDARAQKTGSNGKTSFEDIIGGEVRASVSVKGKLCETRTIYLEETRVVVFMLDRYVMVAGYPLETTQLITYISLAMLVALFALALIYRRFRTRKVPEEKEKSL